jgi:hypothetical protein
MVSLVPGPAAAVVALSASVLPGLIPLAVPVLAIGLATWSWRLATPARVVVGPDAVTVIPSGPTRIWAWLGPVRVARWSVTDARVTTDLHPPPIRVAGTAIPGLVAMGRFREPLAQRQELWLTGRRSVPAVVLDLAGDRRYTRIVCQVADPEGLVRTILEAS